MAWSPANHDLSGIDTPNHPWSNFAGTAQRQAPHFYTPVRLSDLVAVVYQTSAAGEELHAVGSGHAFEDVAVADDRLVSLSQLKSPLSYVLDGGLTDARRAVQDDPAAPRILFHCHGGITIGELNEVLAANSLAMITLGGANVQALAGAIATSTHGGDVGLPPLSDVVQALHLVTAAGEQVWIERASAPVTTDDRLRAVLRRWEPVAEDLRIRRDDDLFHAALVSCGRFGVVFSVVLEVTRAFSLAEFTVEKPTATVLGRLRAGVASVDAGFGLASLATVLETPPADVGADTTGGPRYLNIGLSSLDPSRCWVQRRWTTTTPGTEGLRIGPDISCQPYLPHLILTITAIVIDAEAVHVALIPVAGPIMALQLAARAAELRARAHAGGLDTGEAFATAAEAARASGLGWVLPLLNRFLVQQTFGGEAGWRRGPSHLVMTGDRESNRICYTGRSTEVVFPANTTAYLDFLNAALPVGPTLRQAGYVSLRLTAPSAALLSMHHLSSRMVVSIEVSSLGGMPDSAAWVAFVERTAVRFGGRPHWGQEHKLTSAEVARFYGADLLTWREQLHTVSGTRGTFSNAFSRRCGLEPAPVPRAATVSQVAINKEVFLPDRFDLLTADFGDVELGGRGDIAMELTNVGQTSLHVRVIGVAGDFRPDELRIDGVYEAATGDYALVALLLTPDRIGPMRGTLTLETDAPGTPVLQIKLAATGHGPVLALDRSTVDFGSVQPGVTAHQTVRLRNDGNRVGELLGAVLTDMHPTPGFTVTPQSATVDPGAFVDLTVSFTSIVAGAAGARLRLYQRRGRMLEVGVSAEQLVAIPELTPSALTFADVPIRRAGDWQSVQLANRGSGPLRIIDYVSGPDFECVGSGPPVLEAGQACTLLIRLRPRTAGAIAADVGVADDAAGSPHVVACTGTGLDVPLLLAQEQGLSFGGQPVGTTGEARTMRFTNDGSTMQVTSVDLIGPDAGDFAVTPGTVAAPIAPEQTCAFDVTFRPTGLGVRSAQLRITSDAYGSPHAFPLDGFGIAAPPMTVDPTVLTFAPHPVGSPAPAGVVTLVNNGAGPLVIGDVTLGGPHAGDFATRSVDCVPGATVAAGASCTVRVDLVPSSVGARAAQLRIEAQHGDAAVVSLKGTGVAAVLAFDPPDTDFGTGLVGGPTDLHEVQLRNIGNTPVLIAALAVEGDFVYSSGCAGNVLAAGGYCTVRLRMRARSTGPIIGRIVAGTADGATTVATLHGIGAAPALDVDPASVTFPASPVGTAGVPVTITVTNTGTWPLTPRNTVLRGPHAADFRLLATVDGAVLRAGESGTIRLTCTPAAAGERTATVEFETNIQIAPHRVPLTGTGTASPP